MTPDEFRTARKALGLSQPGAATALGVHVGTVARWEQGVTRIPHAIELALTTLRRRTTMKTFRTQLAPETIAYFESESGSPDSWDWDEEIVEVVRSGDAPRGSTNYLGENGTMIAEYDAAAEPVWAIDGDDGITWAVFSGQEED